MHRKARDDLSLETVWSAIIRSTGSICMVKTYEFDEDGYDD